MATSKSTPTGRDLGLTPHEERLLEGYFRKRTRPYFVGLMLAGSILAVLLAAGLPGRPDAPREDDAISQQLEASATELRGSFENEIAALRSEIETLQSDLKETEKRSAKASTGDASKQLKSVDSKLSKLGRRLDDMEKRAKSNELQISTLSTRLERGLVDAALGSKEEATANGAAAADAPADDADLAFE